MGRPGAKFAARHVTQSLQACLVHNRLSSPYLLSQLVRLKPQLLSLLPSRQWRKGGIR